MTTVRFEGDLSLTAGCLLALTAAVLSWLLYRREVQRSPDSIVRIVLPLLRSLAIAMLTLLVSGPVLTHRSTQGTITPLLVMLDGSQSMSLTDASMPADRKRSIALAQGWLESNKDREADVTAALERFDRSTRWQRAARLLTESRTGLLASVKDRFDLSVHVLEGDRVAPLLVEAMSAADGLAGREPQARFTDLDQALRSVKGGAGPAGLPAAVVLLSDGQHNRGQPPVSAAKLLASSGVAVFPVALGSPVAGSDLALLEVRSPAAVHADDRVRGQLAFLDSMPPGTPLNLSIEHAGRAVWSTVVPATGAGVRTVDFEFGLRDLTEQGAAQARAQGLELTSVPLNFQVRAQALGDVEARNNDLVLHLAATPQRRKLLIVDARPRWETRFVRNLFDRDTQWDVTTVLAEPEGDRLVLRRGQGPNSFPADARSLEAYDVVILGDLPASTLLDSEQQWLREFVDKRGGGLIWLDGQRRHLAQYGATPLGPLLPVEWTQDAVSKLAPLAVTEAGSRSAMTLLAPEPVASAQVWRSLPPPHWAAAVRALPGSQVLVTAGTSQQAWPMVVLRRFGAGQVLYLATDEWWRWRYEVADKHHQRWWQQVVAALAEEPYAVNAARLSLDAGGFLRLQGDRAPLRVRWRDEQGRPVASGSVEAQWWLKDRKVASVLLAQDSTRPGVYTGLAPPLEPGQYDLKLQVAGGDPGQVLPSLAVTILPPEAAELATLQARRDLLQELASVTGGVMFEEDQLQDLLARLQPMSRGRIIETQTVLARSFIAFVPVLSLLTAEWLLRRRKGLV